MVISSIRFVASSVFTHAKGGSLEERTRYTYRGKVLTLRQFYDGDKLHLDSRGQLTGEATTGPWSVDGQLQVTDLQSGTLHIKAKRLTLVFDPSTKKRRDLIEIRPTQLLMQGDIFRGGKEEERARKPRFLEIDLDIASPPQGMADIESAMNLVFLSSQDDLADLVPEFWKDFVLQHEGKPPRAAPAGEPVYEYKDAASKPRILYQPDPEYSEAAHAVGYFGDAVFSLVVTPQGKVRDVKIVTPAGFGLDEKGIKAVHEWRIEPGQKMESPWRSASMSALVGVCTQRPLLTYFTVS